VQDKKGGEEVTENDIIRDSTSILRSGVSNGVELGLFELGRVAMALEIETTARLLEGVIGDSLMYSSKDEVVSVLRTLLRDQGLDETVTDVYEAMIEDRRLKFIAEGNGLDALTDVPSSEPEAQRDDASPPDGTHE
jgi:hypothetical protein